MSWQDQFGKRWNADETNRLRDDYARGGIAAAEQALPERSRCSLFRRAQKLGISRRRRWTPKDDEELRLLWATTTLRRIAKQIRRTPITTYWRAHKLGLERGCPQGYEYLTAAAKRTGFETGQLWRILRSHGVRPMLSMARPCRGGHRFHIVDPLDVDEALRAWNETEVVNQAAESRGLIADTLRSWLTAARARGVAVPEMPKVKKGHWRVATSIIDEVVAWERARESLSAAALRTGVKRWKLRAWLAAAGLVTGRPKPLQLARDAVDRVVAERCAEQTVKARRSA